MTDNTRALLEQVKAALESCTTGGYVDIDGDFQKTYRFSQSAVDDALESLNAELAKPTAPAQHDAPETIALKEERDAMRKDAALGAALRPNYEAAKEYGVEYIRWNITDIDAELAKPATVHHDAPTVFPDGSAFFTASYPLPKTHWLYAPMEYDPGSLDPIELPAPLLKNAHIKEVIAAIRYAVRGATMCGKELDFDPDALVQNAVYALCGQHVKAIAKAEGGAA